MTHMLQLNPSIPVSVLNKGMGEAIAWFDYGKEDHLLWLVPNTEIRLIENYSIGRIYEK